MTMIEWYVFRVPLQVSYVQRKNADGRPIPGTHSLYTPWPGMHEWMNEHLQGKWTWGETTSRDRPYYIKEKNDAMLFKLTWFDATVKPVFRF